METWEVHSPEGFCGGLSLFTKEEREWGKRGSWHMKNKIAFLKVQPQTSLKMVQDWKISINYTNLIWCRKYQVSAFWNRAIFKVFGYFFIHSGHVDVSDFVNGLFTYSIHIKSQRCENKNAEEQKTNEAAYQKMRYRHPFSVVHWSCTSLDAL